MTRPRLHPNVHRVTLEEMGSFFQDKLIEGASATTLDGTQRKSLCKQGNDYLVRRRYFAGTDRKWEVVYKGSLDEAVRIYNGMS